MDAEEWLVSPRIDGDVGCAEFHRVQRVSCGLLNFDISRDIGDRDHADFRSAQSHDERDGVVRSNVGVDQEGARHPRRITKPPSGRLFPHEAGLAELCS
jgi:hypothetical protein